MALRAKVKLVTSAGIVPAGGILPQLPAKERLVLERENAVYKEADAKSADLPEDSPAITGG